tara:strand:- start:2941 stop:3159 length:219 start_codon:yes stop_codon:yes gene_type:complete
MQFAFDDTRKWAYRGLDHLGMDFYYAWGKAVKAFAEDRDPMPYVNEAKEIYANIKSLKTTGIYLRAKGAKRV